MPSTRELRRRIRSIKNIGQVTRAMQMVAASKMRRAQEQVLATRPYAQKAWDVLVHLGASSQNGMALHPLLSPRSEIKSVGLVLITADKGLCGAYNTNMLRHTVRWLRTLDVPVKVIAIGRRGSAYIGRFGAALGAELVFESEPLPDRPQSLDVRPAAREAIDLFQTGTVDAVYLGYTEFINTLRQEPTIRILLPLSVEGDERIANDLKAEPIAGDYIYEPDPVSILDTIIPRFTEMQVFQAVLEAQASEHSARMVAMRNATENTKELLGDLTLTYNQARQAAITTEMLDIAGGAEALRQARG